MAASTSNEHDIDFLDVLELLLADHACAYASDRHQALKINYL